MKRFALFGAVLALALLTPLAQAEVVSVDGTRAEAPAPAVELDLLLQGEAGDGCAAEQQILTPEPVYQSACTDQCAWNYIACRQSCHCSTRECAAECAEICYGWYQQCLAGC